MLSSHIDDFARSFLLDNRLAALACAAAETVTAEDIIHLAAEAQALHMLAALYCHDLTTIEAYKKLWQVIHEFLEETCQIWSDVLPDGELISAHRALLIRLRDTAADRVAFYCVSTSERSIYRHAKVDEGSRLASLCAD